MRRFQAEALRQEGFGLLEMLIAGLVGTMIFIGASMLMTGMQENYADAQVRTDAQQTTRMAMVWVQRDLQTAGIGLARLQPPFATVLPRDDGGIDLRANPGQITTFLTQGQKSGSADLRVDSIEGFEVGQVVAVYDDTGRVEMTRLTGVNGRRLRHEGLSDPFTQAGTTAVAVVETITYRLDGDEAPFQLIREVDGNDAAVISDQVLGFDLTYFDDSSPAAEFLPTTTAQQMRIRLVEIDLELRAAAERLDRRGTPSFRLTSRVAPRSLTLF